MVTFRNCSRSFWTLYFLEGHVFRKFSRKNVQNSLKSASGRIFCCCSVFLIQQRRAWRSDVITRGKWISRGWLKDNSQFMAAGRSLQVMKCLFLSFSAYSSWEVFGRSHSGWYRLVEWYEPRAARIQLYTIWITRDWFTSGSTKSLIGVEKMSFFKNC